MHAGYNNPLFSLYKIFTQYSLSFRFEHLRILSKWQVYGKLSNFPCESAEKSWIFGKRMKNNSGKTYADLFFNVLTTPGHVTN